MITAAWFAALCAIGCAYEGYDAGKYINKQCACINYYNPKDFTLKKVSKANKTEKTEE